ncbi:restriction endonuclease subunit S [Candidatus Poriferisodalis sp.]|uniref:restriction endonuclease subunit S n=1 Tax=Candidatus Poriferisodalis sp. TaxID=3101277 RepID=UPI003B016DC9
MADWRDCRLGDLGIVSGGGTPSRERAEYWDGPIPWITPGELTGNRKKFVSETQDSLSELGLAVSGANLLPERSLLVTSRASIGSCALTGKPMATNQGFKSLIPHADVDPSFLFHLGQTLGREMTRRASGTTFLEISAREFEHILIRLPPLDEQQRIADILDTIDEAIQAIERVIAKLIRVREGLRRSQFAGLALSSEFHPVGECFEMTLGKMLSPAARTGSNPAPYLANRNVQWERCSLDDLDEMDFTHTERVKFSLELGDVLVCEGGEVGRTAIWHGELKTCFFQKAIHRLRTRGKVMPEFMLHYMKYAAESDLFKMHTSQTSIAHLTGEQLARLPIPVPSKEVQTTVVGVLAALSRRLEVENEQLQKVCRIRNGVSSDLLSGRVRTVAT